MRNRKWETQGMRRSGNAGTKRWWAHGAMLSRGLVVSGFLLHPPELCSPAGREGLVVNPRSSRAPVGLAFAQ